MLRRSFHKLSVIPRANGNPELQFAAKPLHHERLHGTTTLNSTECIHDTVLSTGSPVGGPIGAIGCLMGMGLFGLTYGYNIAVPVMDAYASLEEQGGEEE